MAPDPTSPAVVEGPGDDNLPAYLSNGCLGLRVREVPLQGGVAVVSGLAESHPLSGVEATACAPYPLGGDIQVGGVRLSDFPAQVAAVRQRYDFTCGELVSTFTFATPAANAEVRMVTFCSRTHPTVVAQRVEIRVDRRCELAVGARVDTNDVPGRVVDSYDHPPADDRRLVVGALRWETNGGLMTCGIALATTFSDLDAERRPATVDTDVRSIVSYRCTARADTWYELV